MKSENYWKCSLILLSSGLILGFQNCSNTKMAFNSSAGTNSEASTAGTGTGSTGTDGTTTPGEALSITTLQPALAVRAMACTTCHANISSNIITDFGYGNSFYFGTQTVTGISWNSGSAYGDHGAFSTATAPAGAWTSATIESSATIYVPSETLPSAVSGEAAFKGTVDTIADYLNFMLIQPGGGSTQAPPKVQSLSRIYIGAPTAAQIRSVFNNPSTDSSYVPAKTTSPALSGLTRAAANVFLVDGNMTCDGDLFIDGTILLSNVNLTTLGGCRIYTTGTAFISGPISYASSPATSSLQISSSRAISMGLGTYTESCNAAEYAVLQDYVPNSTDSVAIRFRDMWTVPGYFTRDGIAPVTRGQSVVADGASIRAYHVLQDATCETQGRAVTYQHLLLNAPNIQSRYTGDFDGAIIAEVFIGALGNFKYTFDPIFSSTSVLPLLDPSVYLSSNQ